MTFSDAWEVADSKYEHGAPRYEVQPAVEAEARRYRVRVGSGDLGPFDQEILEALRTSRADFRTATSLARQLDVSEEDVRLSLKKSLAQGLVRNPVTADVGYRDWFRLVTRGLTWRERWRRLRAVAGRDFD